MKKIYMRSTEFYIGQNLLESSFLIELCKKLGNKAALIADEALQNLYGLRLSQKLGAQLFTVPSGEKCKTRKVKEQIEDRLLEAHYGRDTVLIALGGGATTDLVGFVASTYLRGVPLILIPTSLLAMVDASIGGKTAINTPMGKNLIGTFYPPKAVICDTQILETLPEKQKLNGLAEILKIGLTSDASIWNIPNSAMDLEFRGHQSCPSLNDRSSEILMQYPSPHDHSTLDHSEPPKFQVHGRVRYNIQSEELMVKAIEKKIEIVEQDPFEKGIRRVLNFGHTIGHALEVVTHYKMTHGEAVWLGCVAESYLSHILGYLSLDDLQKIHQLPIFPTFKWPKCDPKQLIKALFFDKKKALDKIRFVLIDEIGHTVPFDGHYCSPVDAAALNSTFHWMQNHYG